MQPYQENLARLLAQSGALFFRAGLKLKDGRPTPYFVNLGVFRSGRLALELGRCFAAWLAESGQADKVDVLLGPSYTGSAIAQATAIALWQDQGRDLLFEYDRKEQKTHGEASGQGNMFVTGALSDGARVLILDDVGTSMATKVELLEKLAAHEQGRVKEGARGADALAAFTQKTGLPVWSLLGIRQCAEYLHACGEPVLVEGQRRPLDAGLLRQVREYLAVYGREA